MSNAFLLCIERILKLPKTERTIMLAVVLFLMAKKQTTMTKNYPMTEKRTNYDIFMQ